MDRRCFTVQVSREAQMLTPSTSTEEAVGTGPCFYLSPSSSVVTKAKEELFGALTDMFSSCTRLQGRISGQSCPEAPSGRWHDVKSLPASPVDYPTWFQNICCLQFLRNVPFGKIQFIEVGLPLEQESVAKAERPDQDKSQTLLRNPVTWNVMENRAGNTEITDISLVLS